MAEGRLSKDELVFGLDIGTRNVVGTVGRREDGRFHVIGQWMTSHDTRAMIDGQIHDIGKVGQTVLQVKERLQEMTGETLSPVCIAAAGRVLRTVTTSIQLDLEQETVLDADSVYSLDMLAMEKAKQQLAEENDSSLEFYCVGYSVVNYYMNGHVIGNLEGHRARDVGEEMIATFLPKEVVDGLYAAVEAAGLEVASLTLEPIAAIDVAIPEKFRMLNLALIDVGAGTSDVSITRDGSIIAYGMLPMAGDELTEVIAKQYLLDFDEAERVKKALSETGDEDGSIAYHDILGIRHQTTRREVLSLLEPTLEQITEGIGEKILELNGGKPVSAIFVVGGGGKVPGFTDRLAGKLGLQEERVALRGQEVLGDVIFEQEDVVKDSLLVTPIGICLNYYDRRNRFLFVRFNDRRMKVYHRNHLTILDVALEAGFPKEELFGKRGRALNYYVNDSARLLRGETGEPAVITRNGRETNINERVEANDVICITPSGQGGDATLTVGDLPEMEERLKLTINGRSMSCPPIAEKDGIRVLDSHEIQEGDRIRFRNYYLVEELLEYLDGGSLREQRVLLDGREARREDRVYDGCSVELVGSGANVPLQEQTDSADALKEQTETEIAVLVNGQTVTLRGKPTYVFVDVFDYIDFDLTKVQGKGIVTKRNGQKTTGYMQTLQSGDQLEIYWEE